MSSMTWHIFAFITLVQASNDEVGGLNVLAVMMYMHAGVRASLLVCGTVKSDDTEIENLSTSGRKMIHL